VAVTFLATLAPLSARFTTYRSSIFPVNDHKFSAPSRTASTGLVRGSHACPIAPPNPALNPDTQGRFNWRTVPTHYSIEQSQYFQLPLGKPPPRPSVQHSFGVAPTKAQDEIASRKEAVREVFKRCWESYKNRAWTKDELAPTSGGAKDTFGSWGATLVDSLDTLWIMDMKQEFAEAVDAAIKIDFGPKIDGEINVFETIIRYLGGFLGAYDVSGCHDTRILNKAIEVADMAYASFDTPNRMPVSRWSPKKAVDGEKQLPAESVLIAEAASASVEFTRLSQLTGDMRYFDAISRVTDVLDKQQAKTKLPGMWPISVDMRKPDLTWDGFFGLGAMADSVYEYLPKMHQLLTELVQ
jgi:mannosyl-oligosaccharide alpha-1,2-mannosidase